MTSTLALGVAVSAKAACNSPDLPANFSVSAACLATGAVALATVVLASRDVELPLAQAVSSAPALVTVRPNRPRRRSASRRGRSPSPKSAAVSPAGEGRKAMGDETYRGDYPQGGGAGSSGG